VAVIVAVKVNAVSKNLPGREEHVGRTAADNR